MSITYTKKLPLLTFVLLDKVLHLMIHPLFVPCVSINIQGLNFFAILEILNH